MDIYLNITSGNGPRECQWVVVKLAQAFVKEAKRAGLKANIVWDCEAASTAPSLMVGLKGKGANVFAQERLGTIRWIGQSPFRKNHKRKNWFAGVSLVPNVEDVPDLKESDIRYQTLKASGPGGQHVNKTESAVRATHVPTGLTVTASDERSQFANKRLTRIKLANLLSCQREAEESKRKDKIWSAHKSLERGNEIRVYQGSGFIHVSPIRR